MPNLSAVFVFLFVVVQCFPAEDTNLKQAVSSGNDGSDVESSKSNILSDSGLEDFQIQFRDSDWDESEVVPVESVKAGRGPVTAKPSRYQKNPPIQPPPTTTTTTPKTTTTTPKTTTTTPKITTTTPKTTTTTPKTTTTTPKTTTTTPKTTTTTPKTTTTTPKTTTTTPKTTTTTPKTTTTTPKTTTTTPKTTTTPTTTTAPETTTTTPTTTSPKTTITTTTTSKTTTTKYNGNDPKDNIKETIDKILELRDWINAKEDAYRNTIRSLMDDAIESLRREYADLFQFVADTEKEAWEDRIDIKKCFKHTDNIEDVFANFAKCAVKPEIASIQKQRKQLEKIEKDLYKKIQKCNKGNKLHQSKPCLQKEIADIQINIFKIQKTVETYLVFEKKERSGCVEKVFFEIDDDINEKSKRFNNCVENIMDKED